MGDRGPLAQMRVLRRRGNYLAGVDPESGQLIVAAAPHGDRDIAKMRLQRMAEAHARLSTSARQPALDYGERAGAPYVRVLARPLRCDFQHVREAASTSRARCSYPQALPFIEAWFDALRATHDAGLSFGALSTSNLWVDDQGGMCVLGAGDNVLALSDEGTPLFEDGIFVAPEVASAAAHSPAGDLYALVGLLRAHIPLVSFPDVAKRVLSGSCAEELELLRLYRWVGREILAHDAAQRPSVEAAWQHERRAWELLDATPDREGCRRYLRAHMDPGGGVLHVDAELRHVRFDGTPIALASRAPLRRVLAALLELRASDPCAVLTTDDLATHGWPGERPKPHAARSRVYVALSALRGLGLSSVIQRHDGGFRLSPQVSVEGWPTEPLVVPPLRTALHKSSTSPPT